jgi:hypothetical protein
LWLLVLSAHSEGCVLCNHVCAKRGSTSARFEYFNDVLRSDWQTAEKVRQPRAARLGGSSSFGSGHVRVRRVIVVVTFLQGGAFLVLFVGSGSNNSLLLQLLFLPVVKATSASMVV